jgi:hypothetical protein
LCEQSEYDWRTRDFPVDVLLYAFASRGQNRSFAFMRPISTKKRDQKVKENTRFGSSGTRYNSPAREGRGRKGWFVDDKVREGGESGA